MSANEGRSATRPDHDFIPGHPKSDLCNLTACQRPKREHTRDTGTGWPMSSPARTATGPPPASGRYAPMTGGGES